MLKTEPQRHARRYEKLPKMNTGATDEKRSPETHTRPRPLEDFSNEGFGGGGNCKGDSHSSGLKTRKGGEKKKRLGKQKKEKVQIPLKTTLLVAPGKSRSHCTTNTREGKTRKN